MQVTGARKKPGKLRLVRRLRISARDNASGLHGMQVTANRKSPGKLRLFETPGKLRLGISITTRSKVLHVRVRDRAGNFSGWRKVSLVRRGQARSR